MMGTAKIAKAAPQIAEPKPQKYPTRLTTPSGMTAPAKVYPPTSEA